MPRSSQKIKKNPTLGIVLVSYGHALEIADTLTLIEPQKQHGDCIVVLDNHPGRSTEQALKNNSAIDILLTANNVGFAAGCNMAVKAMPSSVDIVLLLNPDAHPEPTALAAIRYGKPDWAAWMGLLIMPNGKVNSAGNLVHLSGLAWCGGYDDVPAAHTKDIEVPFLSGACMAVRRGVWQKLGGFNERYFMYYEDIDLSARLRLGGERIGLIAGAHFIHDYDYVKGEHKWFYLERNRWLFILMVWPWKVIALLLPVLLVSELGLWLISIATGWGRSRLEAILAVIKTVPAVLSDRHRVQASSAIPAKDFLTILEPTIKTLQLGSLLKFAIPNAILRGYYRLVRKAMGTSHS